MAFRSWYRGHTRTIRAASSYVESLAALPLLGLSNFTYDGYFNGPTGGSVASGTNFTYGGHCTEYRPGAIPEMVGTAGSEGLRKWGSWTVPQTRMSNFLTASIIAPAAIIDEGRSNPEIGTGNFRWGGFITHNGASYLNGSVWYNGTNPLSMYKKSNPDLTALGGDITGAFALDGPPIGGVTSGAVSGWLIPIPAEWQAALGGNCFAGQGCQSTIVTNSSGMAANSFWIEDVGVIDPVPVNALLYYPIGTPRANSHPMNFAEWQLEDGVGTGSDYMTVTSKWFNGASKHVSGICVPGTRSLVFVYRHALGPVCYGPGCVPAQSNAYHALEGGWCMRAAAYDLLDLKKVYDGVINPATGQPWQGYEIFPYDEWSWDYLGLTAHTAPTPEMSVCLDTTDNPPGTIGRMYGTTRDPSEGKFLRTHAWNITL